MAKNGQKMAKNGQKWPKMAKNGHFLGKSRKMAKNGQNGKGKSVIFGHFWPFSKGDSLWKMAKNGQKWHFFRPGWPGAKSLIFCSIFAFLPNFWVILVLFAGHFFAPSLGSKGGARSGLVQSLTFGLFLVLTSCIICCIMLHISLCPGLCRFFSGQQFTKMARSVRAH